MEKHIHTTPAAEPKGPWWKNPRARTAGIIIGTLVLMVFVFWLIEYMPYASTEDARVDAAIIKVANLGASGQIVAINAKEGDRVKKDSILAELDHSIARANYDKAKAKAVMTAVDLKRAEAMVSSRGISRQQLDRSRNDAAAASAELRLAEIALERTYVRSPADGIVIQKTAEIGNILEGNQVAFTVADTDSAWVSANINEKTVSAIRPGQSVKVLIDEGGVLKGKVFEVRRASASVFALIPSDNASGNFVKVEQRIPVKIILDPHPGKELRVGESVVIKIKIR